MIISAAAICLAMNIYQEARNQSVPSQYAVAQVTLTRAKGKRKHICREVFRPKQFSWANKGVTRVKGGWKLAPYLLPAAPHDLDAWDKALRIARWQLAGNMPDLTRGADHYHTAAVKPKWSSKMKRVKKMDSHIFYVASLSQ